MQHRQSGVVKAPCSGLHVEWSGQRSIEEHPTSFQVKPQKQNREEWKVLTCPLRLWFYGNWICLFAQIRKPEINSHVVAGQQRNGSRRPFCISTNWLFTTLSFPTPHSHARFRATLLLVPLLGLQYILTPFRPGKNHPYEATYESKCEAKTHKMRSV